MIAEPQTKGVVPAEIFAGAPLCRAVGLGKQFGGTWACRDIDLAIRRCEVHALLGENGAGKSTLMKMMHGLHEPDEGRIEVDGKPIRFASPREAEAAGIALIPQELDLFPDLSVTENLFVGRSRPRNWLGGFDWRTMRARAQAIFETLGVELDVGAPARSLSGANAQMVEIGRALMREARIILMDEPTAALTERETQRLFAIIRELTARGVGVVYITHRLEEIFDIADRVTVMRDGAQVWSGPIDDVSLPKLVQLMVGRPLEKLFHRSRRKLGEALLEVRGLSRRDSFHDISLTLRRGEVVGLAGLIGAGRSELAQTIFGLHAASGGEIRIDGRCVQITNPRAAIRQGIFYVPEERRSQGLFLDFPIDWNITFSNLKRLSRLGYVIRGREQVLAAHFREVFSIRGGSLATSVGALSGGNQQKVLLSKCLALKPDIILLDEPTRGVDVGAKAEIYRIIDELAQAGKAVLMISSDMIELLSMSDRVLALYQGRLSGEFEGPDYPVHAVGAAVTGVRA